MRLMEQLEDGVPRAEVQSKVRPHLELVLDVAEDVVLAQIVDRQSTRQTCSRHLIRCQRLQGCKRNCSVFPVMLVQLDAAEFRSGFDGVPAMEPGQVVDIRKSVAHVDAVVIVVLDAESRPRTRGNRNLID